MIFAIVHSQKCKNVYNYCVFCNCAISEVQKSLATVLFAIVQSHKCKQKHIIAVLLASLEQTHLYLLCFLHPYSDPTLSLLRPYSVPTLRARSHYQVRICQGSSKHPATHKPHARTHTCLLQSISRLGPLALFSPQTPII